MSEIPTLSDARRILLEKYLSERQTREVLTVTPVEQGIEADTSDQYERVVLVQKGKTKRPFFYLHGDETGRAFYCYPLAHELGEEQPFYILEPYSFDMLLVPPTFEEMAAAHIKRMRTIQSEGPYLLGGWCNGGLVAYEMARQLDAEGQKVDLLLMMDPDPPAKYGRDHRLITAIGDLLRCDQKQRFEMFLVFRRWRLLFHYWRLNILKRGKASRDSEPEQSDEEVLLGLVDEKNGRDLPLWEQIFNWIASGYRPKPYGGRMTFFWTSEGPLRRKRWEKWLDAEKVAHQVETYIIPGNHITSRTRYLPILSEHLRMCLEKAQG